MVGVQTVVSLFRLVEEKSISSLINTRFFYLEYLVNLDVKPKNEGNSRFGHIRTFLDAVAEKYEETNHSFYSKLFADILRKMMNKIANKDERNTTIVQ